MIMIMMDYDCDYIYDKYSDDAFGGGGGGAWNEAGNCDYKAKCRQG